MPSGLTTKRIRRLNTPMPRTIQDLGPHVANRYPYTSKFANVNGWRMHYIDEGPVSAPPVFLLMETPWGYLYRDTIPSLLKLVIGLWYPIR